MDRLTVTAINIDEVALALKEAPIESWRFAKTEMDRFAKRVRRKTIRGMSGRMAARGPSDQFGRAKGKIKSVRAKSPSEPLYGGQFKKGGHIQGFATGGDLASLVAVSKISRILRVHEEGAVITPVRKAFLFLSRKTQTAGAGRIFSRVKSVTIPPRLHFTETWEKEIPDGGRRVMDGIHRAVRVVMDRRMKAISSAVGKLSSL